jgi:spore coat protein U-like protein
MINLRKPMKNKLLKTRPLGLAMAVVLATGSFYTTASSAATATTNLEVTATVAASCSITTTPVAFGEVPTNGSTVSTNGAIKVTCSNGTTAVVTLDEGLNKHMGSTPVNPYRQMKHSSTEDFLIYNLYSEDQSTTFGTGEGPYNTLTGTGAEHSINVYGTAAFNTDNGSATPGSYTDTVVATVTY